MQFGNRSKEDKKYKKDKDLKELKSAESRNTNSGGGEAKTSLSDKAKSFWSRMSEMKKKK